MILSKFLDFFFENCVKYRKHITKKPSIILRVIGENVTGVGPKVGRVWVVAAVVASEAKVGGVWVVPAVVPAVVGAKVPPGKVIKGKYDV